MASGVKMMNTDRSFSDEWSIAGEVSADDMHLTLEFDVTLFQSRFEGSATLYVFTNLDDRRTITVDLDVTKDVRRDASVEGATIVRCPTVKVVYSLTDKPLPEDLTVGVSVQTVWDDDGEAASMPGGAGFLPLSNWIAKNKDREYADPATLETDLITRLFSDHMVSGATREDDLRGKVVMRAQLHSPFGISTRSSNQRVVNWDDASDVDVAAEVSRYHIDTMAGPWLPDVRRETGVGNLDQVIDYLPRIRPVQMEAPSAGIMPLYLYMMHGKRWRPDGISIGVVQDSIAYECGRRAWSLDRFTGALNDLVYGEVKRPSYQMVHIEALDVACSVLTHLALSLKYRQDAYTSGRATGRQEIVNGEDHGDALGDDAADDGAGGDCDDLNELTLAVATFIRRLDAVDSTSDTGAALLAINRLLQLYVPISWTLSVKGADARSAAMGGSVAENPFKSDNVGAHANAHLIPAHVYLEMLQRHLPGMKTLPAQLFGGSRPTRTQEHADEQVRRSRDLDLPVLCLESTGPMFSVLLPASKLMGEDSALAMMSDLADLSSALLAPTDVGKLVAGVRELPMGPEWDEFDRRVRPPYISMDVQGVLMNFYMMLSTAYLAHDELLMTSIDGVNLMLNVCMPTRGFLPPASYRYVQYPPGQFGHGISVTEMVGEYKIEPGLLPMPAPSVAAIEAARSAFLTTKPSRGAPSVYTLLGPFSAKNESRLANEAHDLGLELKRKVETFHAAMASRLGDKFSPKGLAPDADDNEVRVLYYAIHNTRATTAMISTLAQDLSLRPRVVKVSLVPEWASVLNATWALSIALQVGESPVRESHPIRASPTSTSASIAFDRCLAAAVSFR